jgi:hypothetical protein
LARATIVPMRGRVDAPYAPRADDGMVVPMMPGSSEWVSAVDWEARTEGRSVLVLARSGVRARERGAELARAAVPFVMERGAAIGPWYMDRHGAVKRAASIVRAFSLLALARGSAIDAVDARGLVAALPAKGAASCFERGTKGKAVKALSPRVWDDAQPVRPRDLADMGVRVPACGTLTEAWAVLGGADPVVAALVERHGDGVLETTPGVRVTTCHGSKGREADLVVYDAMLPYPSRLAVLRGDADEERRLAYVAVTRTRETLIVLRGEDGEDALDLLGVALPETLPETPPDVPPDVPPDEPDPDAWAFGLDDAETVPETG